MNLGVSDSNNLITLAINTTTGGNFQITIENDSKTIEHLKKLVSKKLKVPKDRWVLIFNNRELQDGTIKENGLIDGSKIILTPNVETGLLAQRAENTVMQALESLNDAQVNDFLSGKSPLNLSVRLGDHMMLIQLQLSTLSPTTSSAALSSSVGSKVKSLPRSKTISTNTSQPQSFYGDNSMSNVGESSSSFRRCHSDGLAAGASSKITEIANTLKTDTSLLNDDYDSIEVPTTFVVEDDESKQSANFSDLDTMDTDSLLDQSPIKSLSNLVSGPIKTTPIIRNNNVVPVPHNHFTTSSPIMFDANNSNNMCSVDPISANLTSCLCKRLDTSSASNTSCDIGSCHSSSGYISATSSCSTPSTPVHHTSSTLHRTLNSPIAKTKHQQVAKAFFRKAMSAESVTANASPSKTAQSLPSTPTSSSPTPSTSSVMDTLSANNTIDNTALAEASRNLTQTLRKLSKRCFPNKIDITEDNSRKLSAASSASKSTALASSSSSSSSNSSNSGAGTSTGSTASGAVIESMKHHGKGIYSGTFSGTLNPALQDRYGRPKRDISTIIHILNDLLSAAPQCARSGAKIIFEPATPNNSVQSSSLTQSSSKYTPKTTPLSASTTPHRYQPLMRPACTSCTKTCTYGECNGHYNNNNNHSNIINSPASSNYSQATLPTSNCSAVRRLNESFDKAESSKTTFTPYPHCKCLQNTSPSYTTSNSIMNAFEMENNKTKCKVDQLRLVMQQKKERREARKLKIAPYSANRVAACDLLPNLALATATTMTSNKSTSTASDSSGSTTSSSTATSTSIAAITTASSESSPNCCVEEVDTVA